MSLMVSYSETKVSATYLRAMVKIVRALNSAEEHTVRLVSVERKAVEAKP